MLTRLRVKNFKSLKDIDIELGQNVVFIGPNNSGKTTALQALALWSTGNELWSRISDQMMDPRLSLDASAGFQMDTPPTINRLDLTALPVPYANLLWHNLRVINGEQVYIEIEVEGTDNNEIWRIGYQFSYANEESLNCVLTTDLARFVNSLPVTGFLPPMSGLSAIEDKFERGSINRRIGEGRTAEVLRNLCYQVYEDGKFWSRFVKQIEVKFNVEILPPQYLPTRGELRMSYRTVDDILLDLASAGRGMQQTMLLLAYMYLNPGAILLLDEPDAHLEILRQQEIYQLLTEVAHTQNSQIIAASHSEVILNEAADRDTVIAFIGKPHRINPRNSQVIKALRDIPFDHYYLAQQTGWVLYVEGATDLAILKAFAKKLDHPTVEILERVFTHTIGTNDPKIVRDHFFGLREAKPDLVGFALFDRIPHNLGTEEDLIIVKWLKREIENYLFFPEVLMAFAAYGEDDSSHRQSIMKQVIEERIPPVALRDRQDIWWSNTKASNDFLDPVFQRYYAELELPNLMYKTNYHVLADYITPKLIDAEVVEKLDGILAVANRARPYKD